MAVDIHLKTQTQHIVEQQRTRNTSKATVGCSKSNFKKIVRPSIRPSVRRRETRSVLLAIACRMHLMFFRCNNRQSCMQLQAAVAVAASSTMVVMVFMRLIVNARTYTGTHVVVVAGCSSSRKWISFSFRVK